VRWLTNEKVINELVGEVNILLPKFSFKSKSAKNGFIDEKFFQF